MCAILAHTHVHGKCKKWMENLQNSLFLNSVPESWTKRAYPSMQGLSAWYADLLLRIRELEQWVSDFSMPSCIWLAGFFNPQSFLTAIMQITSREKILPLDNMSLQTNVTLFKTARPPFFIIVDR